MVLNKVIEPYTQPVEKLKTKKVGTKANCKSRQSDLIATSNEFLETHCNIISRPCHKQLYVISYLALLSHLKKEAHI